MIYTGKLKGGPPMAAKFRLVIVDPGTELIAVMLPPDKDPVPYLSRDGEEKKPYPTPETHLIVPIPIAIFKRKGEFRWYKSGQRAIFEFLEMQDQSYAEPPEATDA